MCIACDKTFGTVIFYLLTLTLKFDLLLKNFNLGHNFLARRDGAFILDMCIPCDKTFHLVQKFLTLTLKYYLLLKTLTMASTKWWLPLGERRFLLATLIVHSIHVIVHVLPYNRWGRYVMKWFFMSNTCCGFPTGCTCSIVIMSITCTVQLVHIDLHLTEILWSSRYLFLIWKQTHYHTCQVGKVQKREISLFASCQRGRFCVKPFRDINFVRQHSNSG